MCDFKISGSLPLSQFISHFQRKAVRACEVTHLQSQSESERQSWAWGLHLSLDLYLDHHQTLPCCGTVYLGSSMNN